MEAINAFFFLVVPSVILYVYFFINNKSSNAARKALNMPPGPPKLPLIGNIHQMTGGLPHRVFRDLARQKYGPIMSFQLGQISAVIVSSPRVAKEVLKTHDIDLANRPNVIGANIVMHGSTGIVLSHYGEYWRQMRKLSNLHLFTVKKIKSFGKIREEEFDRFRSFIQSSDGEPINMYKKIAAMVNNIICISALGRNCRYQQQLIEFMDETSKEVGVFSLDDLFPEYKFLPTITGKQKRLTKTANKVSKIFDAVFEDHKERKKHGNEAQQEEQEEEGLLDSLFRMKDEGGLEFPITISEIRAVLADIFSAGTDTTSVTLVWAMTEMMRSSRVMEKVRAEVRGAFKGKATITEEELQGLSYLHAIIRETLRLHPPLPLLVPHVCKEQCKIEGYDILVGQQVILNAWACATDPEYWEDPESFKPERFDKSSVDFMGQDYEIIPFGAGRRMCPGTTFALRTMEYFLAHMINLYDWKLPHGLTPATIDMTEDDGLMTSKKIPLQLVFKPSAQRST